jgi:hypothetical protein
MTITSTSPFGAGLRPLHVALLQFLLQSLSNRTSPAIGWRTCGLRLSLNSLSLYWRGLVAFSCGCGIDQSSHDTIYNHICKLHSNLVLSFLPFSRELRISLLFSCYSTALYSLGMVRPLIWSRTSGVVSIAGMWQEAGCAAFSIGWTPFLSVTPSAVLDMATGHGRACGGGGPLCWQSAAMTPRRPTEGRRATGAATLGATG